MTLRSPAKNVAHNPRSSDFFCVIEPCAEDRTASDATGDDPSSRTEEARGRVAPSNGAVVTLLWGSTVVAMRTFTRAKRVSVGDLGVTEDIGGPSFEIKRDARGFTIHTPHGDAVPRGFRMRMLCSDGSSNVAASRRATSLMLVCEAVTLEKGKVAALLPDARGLGLSALAVALFPLLLGILRVGAPDPRAPEDMEAQRDRIAFVQTALAAADKRTERAEPAADDGTESNGASPSRGGTSGSSKGEEGSQGDTSTRSEEGLARAEQRKSAPPSVQETALEATTFGMISLLDRDDKNARPASAFAAQDVDAANGGQRGDIFRDAFGMGSAGLSGVGEGGGGLGAGVGITRIGALGHGVASAREDGSLGGYDLGRTSGRLREHASRFSYRFDSGDDYTQVNGRLPPESVQRVVRSNFGRIRACYEDALLRSPQLEGRVSVKFVIARNGAVSAAEIGENTTLADAKASACIVAQYKQMAFPEPEGGIVTVVYPVVFSRG